MCPYVHMVTVSHLKTDRLVKRKTLTLFNGDERYWVGGTLDEGNDVFLDHPRHSLVVHLKNQFPSLQPSAPIGDFVLPQVTDVRYEAHFGSTLDIEAEMSFLVPADERFVSSYAPVLALQGVVPCLASRHVLD